MDLIAELKKRQVSPLVREGKDGAIEDIITGTQHLETHTADLFSSRKKKESFDLSVL